MASKEKSALKKSQSSFMLYGVARVNEQYTYKIDEKSKNSDWIYNSMNIGIECGEYGTIYAEMMGGYGADRENFVYLHGKKEEDGKMVDDFSDRIKLDWDQRLEESMFDSYGNNCFIRVGIANDEKGNLHIKKFLSEYDAIAYIKEYLTDGMVVRVRGDLEYSQYENTVRVKKKITSIYLAKEDPEKYTAEFTQGILITKDSVDDYDKDTETYPVYAKVVDYVGKVRVDGKQVEVKQNVTFNSLFYIMCPTAEKGKMLVNRAFKPKKSGEVWEVVVEGFINRAGSTVNVSLDDLGEDIRYLVECEILTEEEALEKAVPNAKVSEKFMIKNPKVKFVGDEKIPKFSIITDKFVEDDFADYATFMPDSDDEDETTTSTSSDNSAEEEVVVTDDLLDSLLAGMGD